MGTNVNISGTQTGFCSESDISISSADPAKIISASNTPNNQGQYWSKDGGATWQQTILPLDLTDLNHTDPGVNWTKDGTAWSTVLGMQMPGFICRIYKSTDGGGTWQLESTPSGTQTASDRQTLWVDRNPSSPHYDNMYMIWHNGTPAFVVARQGPGGTWSAPLQISAAETTGSAVGADIKTNANGDVFGFWPDTGSSALYVAKSTDGGTSFSTPQKIANTFAAFKIQIPADNARDAAVYISGGAYSGSGLDMVYACWTDLAGGAGCSVPGDAPAGNAASSCTTRIWFASSPDGGGTWGAPIKINDAGAKNDQFFPRLGVDDATGRLIIIYYDTAGDPNRVKTNVWMQSSDDHGATWSGPLQVTTGQTDETQNGEDLGNQYGDYIGLSAVGGRFFACWTDRRNGGFEQIWGAQLAVPTMTFAVEKSTFGQDEVAAHASYPSAFWLEMDGFANKTLGFNGPGDLSNNPPSPAPSITPTVDPALNSGLTAMQIATIAANLPAITFGPTPIVAADPTLQQDFQRFMYPYTIAFANDNAFNALNAHQTAIVTLQASFTAGQTNFTATAAIELAKGEDPYVTDVNPQHPADFPFWLSYDLRFFKVTPSQPHQMFSVPNPASAGDAVTYIRTVLQHLNNPSLILNGDTFENTLQQGESESSLEFLPKNASNELTFNFAVARVRILGNSATSVFPVRVFFRLFQAQTTGSDFDQNTSYRWGTDGVNADHKIALLGVQNDQNGNPEYVTIPCFATERINLTAPADMNKQHDDPNAQTITTIPGVEVDTYFGCWLDVNQPQQTFLIPTPPAAQAQWDGPWPGTQSISGAITVSPHQCLIAEIRFDDTPVPKGATSATSDKLAQRNIAWIDGPNPGTAPSRIMAHPFDVRASNAAVAELDELMITWGNTPAGSTASLYFPALDAADIVALATRMYPSHRLTASDPNTIACPASGTTYIPVPKGEGRYAGLLSVNLPAGIQRGDSYDIAIRQLTRAAIGYKRGSEISSLAVEAVTVPGGESQLAWRRLLGAFQITIKISTKEQLLYPEERLLAWLKWRLEVTPHESRWYPVLLRYSHVVGGRVGSWGGNPGTIPPSPEGNVPGHKPQPPGHPGEGHHQYCGKVAGIFYDQFGDFEGFLLKTEHGREHWFSGCEREIEALVNRAWCERIVICVFVEPHKPKYPLAIEFRRPGECCDVRGRDEHEEHESREKHGRHEKHERHERREEHEEREEDSPLERLESFGKRLLFGRREEPEKHEREGERDE